MAQDYTEYLAINVLNEQQHVSYRLLSRALKVHSNLAKQMLYEFHRKQNAKKPGSVHATYLITGIRRVETAPAQTNGVHSQDGEDTVMQSSPVLASSSAAQPDWSIEEPSLVRSVMLVKEEHLEQAKSTFDTISSIHIYSLEANSPKDVQVLTECNRKVAANYASEDPLEVWKQYGTIQNPNVKRRTRRTAPPPPPPIASTEIKINSMAPTAKPKADTEGKAESKSISAKATPELDKKNVSKPATTKRQNSDIFKSFAKSKTKSKQESQSSAEATPAPEPEDEPMGGCSEDEADDVAADEPEEEVIVPGGKSKKDRKAELQAMMDQEDEPMEDTTTPGAESQEAEDVVNGADNAKEEEPKESVTVENGRRRGRRRVMKKKTVKDEEGYLVTKEEAAWESFSEDEPPPKKIKVPPVSSASSGGKATAKKSGKGPSGNIMSFFSKK